MLPRLFRLMLTGQAGDERQKPRTPPIAFQYDPALLESAKTDPRVRHDYTAGAFTVVDPTAPASAAAVTITPVDDSVGRALAAELHELAGQSSTR